MAFFFSGFPKINYDLEKNGNIQFIQNPLVRFRLKEIIRTKSALYYEHDIKDGQSAQFIANRYYGDSRLDWVIYLVNDIFDPIYDWYLGYFEFIEFVKVKYGAVETAQSTVHHYEQILQSLTINTDESVVEERVLIVDETTYNSLSPSNRRVVYDYDFEVNENEKRRRIKILDKSFLTHLLAEVKEILRESRQ